MRSPLSVFFCIFLYFSTFFCISFMNQLISYKSIHNWESINAADDVMFSYFFCFSCDCDAHLF